MPASSLGFLWRLSIKKYIKLLFGSSCSKHLSTFQTIENDVCGAWPSLEGFPCSPNHYPSGGHKTLPYFPQTHIPLSSIYFPQQLQSPAYFPELFAFKFVVFLTPSDSLRLSTSISSFASGHLFFLPLSFADISCFLLHLPFLQASLAL